MGIKNVKLTVGLGSHALTYQTLITEWKDLIMLAKAGEDLLGRNILNVIIDGYTYTCSQLLDL